MLRAVIDTNVLFEGLTRRGPSADVVDAWVARAFTPCVSTALALEYEEVLTNKLGDRKRPRAVGALQALLGRCEFIPIWYAVRPVSPDPDGDFVIECAYNAGAALVTHNLKDLLAAQEVLGVTVHSAAQFLAALKEH
jgi:predicted nucleic acid-binding protein